MLKKTIELIRGYAANSNTKELAKRKCACTESQEKRKVKKRKTLEALCTGRTEFVCALYIQSKENGKTAKPIDLSGVTTHHTLSKTLSLFVRDCVCLCMC